MVVVLVDAVDSLLVVIEAEAAEVVVVVSVDEVVIAAEAVVLEEEEVLLEAEVLPVAEEVVEVSAVLVVSRQLWSHIVMRVSLSIVARKILWSPRIWYLVRAYTVKREFQLLYVIYGR